MKHQTSHISSRRQGFTLVETVIAMGVITIMITAFLAAFGPSVKGVRKSLSAKEASRLSTTLEYELSVLKPYDVDRDSYKTKFQKAYEWIKGSTTNNQKDMVLLYQYRGATNSTPNTDDGTLPPYTGTTGIAGQDYILQSVVRRFNNPHVKDELVPGVVHGSVFFVKMNQLIYNTKGEMIISDKPGEILDPHGANNPTTYDTYPDATISYQANFYKLKSNIYTYIEKTFTTTDANQDGHPDATGRPIFTRNLSARR